MNNEKKRILIIEDDTTLLLNIKDILEEEGFLVRTEADGSDGLQTALNWLPDLIICDISLPSINGYDVLRELLNSNKKTIPFIFLTAKVEREDIRKGMQLGADDYIFKPFDLNDLLNSIKLRLQRIHRGTKQQTSENENKIYEINDKLLVKTGLNLHFCEIRELKFLKAKNPYVLLCFDHGKSSLQRQTLDEWESKLPSRHFLRIHRSTIINIDYIVKIEKLSRSSYVIRLRGEEEPFIVSKRYSSRIKENFS